MYETAAATPPGGLAFRRLGLIARRQWWIVVGCIVLAGAGSLAYVKTRTITYTATASVTVVPANFSTATGTSGSTTASASASAIFSGTLAPSQEIAATSVTKAADDAAHTGTTLEAVLSTDETVVYVGATAPSAAQAVAGANAAGRAFVIERIKDLDAADKGFNSRLATISDTIATLKAQIKAAGATGNSGTAPVSLTFYEGLYTSELAEQSTLLDAAASSSLSTPATLATTKSDAKGKKVLEVSLAAGLLAGLGIALAREQFDDKIRTSGELSEITGVELLAELPVSDLGPRASTIADKPFGETAEAVRELRTAMRFLSVKRPLRTVLVTSAGMGEGKTFVAANLAVAWAMSGVKTILVSSDLRRPTLDRIFNIEATGAGLSEAIVDAALVGRERSRGMSYLPGEEEDEEESASPDVVDLDLLLVPTGIEGLQLLPSGKSPPNPAELLGSPELGKLLVALRERAEIVVLDSPPVQAVTDPLVLTAQADGVLFVVSEGRTSRGAAQRALRLLDSGLAPVLGVVVNRSSRPQTISHY
jgi:polysaccharide biosynthesis transport protein